MSGTHHDPVSIEYIAREVEMYSLTKNEILSLRSSDGTLEIGLASAAVSGFLTLLITLLTIAMNPSVHAAFIAATIATGFIAIFFGIKAFMVRLNSGKVMNSMFERDAQNTVQPIRRGSGA